MTLEDGSLLVLDAGTGIRPLGLSMDRPPPHIDLLITHLHLDHIQGLLFFTPLFWPESEITIWGPAAPGGTLEERIGRYLSAPLTPVEVRELPCAADFRECPPSEWTIGSAAVRAEAVSHRGPTLGFRIEADGASLCYLPDHEPRIAGPLDQLEEEWISGHRLAEGADLLVHDCQYTEDEYSARIGWGHSSLDDALRFARRAGARHTALFHHDPLHGDDELDRLAALAAERWRDGRSGDATISVAAERKEIELGSVGPRRR